MSLLISWLSILPTAFAVWTGALGLGLLAATVLTSQHKDADGREGSSSSRAFARLVAEMNALPDPREALRMLLDAAREMASAQAATLYRWLPAQDSLTALLTNGFSAELAASLHTLPLSVAASALDALLRRGQPCRINDLAHALPSASLAITHGYRALWLWPVSHQGQTLGALALWFVDAPSTIEDEMLLLACLAQMGMLMAGIRRREEQEEERERFVHLCHLFQRDNPLAIERGTPDIGELIDCAAVLALDLLKADVLEIVLVDAGSELPRHVATVGPLAEPFRQAPCTPGQGVIGDVLRRGEAVVLGDVRQEPRYVAVVPEIRSELCVPLKAGGAVTGAINAESCRLDAFSEADVRLLSLLALQLAVSIENARLLGRERRRAEQLNIVNEVGRHLVAILDIDELLGRMAYLLRDAFGQYDVNILIVDQQTKELVWRAGTRFEQPSYIPSGFVRVPLGQGIVGWVAAHGQPLLVNNVLEEPRYLLVPELPDTRSELAVPIMRGERVLGVLDAQSSHFDAYDEDDVFILQTFASQMAVALENARLFGETQKHAAELEALRQVGLRLSSTVDLKSGLDIIVESALRLVNASGAHICLYDEETRKLTFGAALWAEGGPAPAGVRQCADALAAQVVRERRSIIVDDIAGHPLHLEGTAADEPKAIAGLPLLLGGRLLGVLDVAFLRPHIFAEDELRALNLLADQAVLSIERARLFDELTHRVNQLSSLYQMAQQTTSTLSLQNVLELIVAELGKVISCRAICIFLLDERTEELRIAAASGLKPEFRDRTRIKIGEGVSGIVFQTLRPIYIRNIPKEAPNLNTDPSIRSLLVAPLIAKSRVIGTLSVDSTAVDAFAASDEHLLTIVAAQAASAIENAQLYEAEKRRAEELRRAYEELKELDRLKSQFVQNISHELRTPLTFIKGYVDLFLDEALGPINDRQRQSLEVVSRKTEAITRLVNDIITLQEIEALPLKKSVISLRDLLKMIAASAQAAAMNADITLQANIPDVPMWVLADDDRLIQVFDNLIGNAIKFSPHGGTIVIRAYPQEDQWVVAVQDNGIGIPSDKLDRIFERFYQVDGSSTRRFGGTGLGLAIAKEIVVAHQGRIWAESVLGEGSVFYVSLPRHADAEGSEPHEC